MAMMISVPEARRIDDGIWKVKLSPAEARILGTSASTYGPVSVVLLSESPSYNNTNKSLSFNPGAVHLLNLGTSDQTIIVHSDGAPRAGLGNKIKSNNLSFGDTRFISELPAELRELGDSLLHEIRKHFPGELRFYPRSRKYVETPDNFWTVRTQTRDRSFRITIRGKPDVFRKPKSIILKPDMTGYSSLKLSSSSQISELLEILKQVARK